MTDSLSIATCEIPAGTYPIGMTKFATSRPPHSVDLNGFAVMRLAVTNALYARFVNADGYTTDAYWSEMGIRWRQSKEPRFPALWGDARFDASQQPVVGISWYEALAFANWLSTETNIAWRLPTEAEFEAAARGQDDVCPQRDQPHTAAAGRGKPLAADDDAHIAWCGALNLVGNVWEWCSTRWGRNWQSLDYTYPYDTTDGREDLSGSHARVMRGGSWFDPLHDAHPSKRARYLPGSRGSNIGFRLVCAFTDTGR